MGLNQSSLKLNEREIRLVNGWMPKPVQKYNLLYRGTRDGFEPQEFHIRCDNIGGPTLTFIKSEHNLVFGIYIETNWKSKDPPKYKFDD